MNIEVNMNEINSVEQIISEILVENDFNKMNKLINQEEGVLKDRLLFPNLNDDTCFVSTKKETLKPFVKVMKEEDFYKIVGLTKRGLSKKSGKYQDYLYSNYQEAMRLKDDGYICDVLYKALEFQTNLEYVKKLMKNKDFAKEWRNDFGEKSAVELFKSKGDLRVVNIVKERANLN